MHRKTRHTHLELDMSEHLGQGAPETYVKFSIRSHTGENIIGQVQYNLMEVDGGSEKIYKKWLRELRETRC